LLEFLQDFGAAFLATMLLPVGLVHALRFPAFRALVREHGIVGKRWSVWIAAAVTVTEVALGLLAAFAPLGWLGETSVELVFVAVLVLGVLFATYVRRLLNRPWRATSCGCSPFRTPLTPASRAPSAAMVVVALIGLGASAAGRGGGDPASMVDVALGVLWGMTLAGLVLLFPATVPATVGRGAW
jgi:hypothetical protein